MKVTKTIFSFFAMLGMLSFSFVGVLHAEVDPAEVDITLPLGGEYHLEKTVTTPEIPTVLDVCLLEDESGSFGDDIANLQGGTTASDLYDAIVAASPGAHFAVAGFRDYPVFPYGSPGDHVYRLLSSMSPAKAAWLAGIAGLSAGGGLDIPEAQYDAIVAATGPGAFNDPTLGLQGNCGWRDPGVAPGVQRVLVVTTDAPFHTPDGTHVNDNVTTLAALNAQNVIVVGLKALGAGGELDALAAATGGSVQPLSSDGANIAAAILDALGELTTDVWWETSCDAGLSVTLDPEVYLNVPGGSTLDFEEWIEVGDDPALSGKDLHCEVTFIANHYPDEGTAIGRQEIWVHVPVISCVETVNPHGKTTPPAGHTTLPGPKGGVNEDGFYRVDAVDDDNMVYVRNESGSFTTALYPSGSVFKITEATGATPKEKPMGSSKGKAGAVAAHVILDSDPVFVEVDGGGNAVGETKECLVPRLPK
jgi:hypothetical protein